MINAKQIPLKNFKKSSDVKTSAHIDFDVENNEKDPRFKVGDHMRISKCKNIYKPN